MTAATSAPVTGGAPLVLRRLYLVRFGFALVWALLLVLVGTRIGPAAAVLLVLYPLFDVAAAVVDARATGTANTRAGLAVNIAVSLLAAVGVAVALGSGIPAVLRVWGAWAVVAGVVQLGVAVRRRGLGGQWPMIASGALSAVAGGTFVLQSFGPAPSLGNVAGYAVLGGVFFLASALRLGRAARGTDPAEAR
jgi:uncharacterized membrane protein HdeD (DUF308 family)